MMTSILERHTLLFLTKSGTDFAWKHKESAYPDKAALESKWTLLQTLPAIVRRQSNTAELIPIGISFPIRDGGVRWKMASYITADAIINTVTPCQAAIQCAKADSASGAFVREAENIARQLGIAVGVFGSTALEAVTGLPYLHPSSDIDLVLVPQPGADIKTFGHSLEKLQTKYNIHADTEVALGNGYYVKLNEILSKQLTILAKGGIHPKLLSSHEVWKFLRISGYNRKQKIKIL